MKKIAVYGSLRQGFHNHHLIQNSKYLGTFKSEPEYTLFSLGSFPGLHHGGDTSVTFEVYEVDEPTAERVDILEGYDENDIPENNFYNKVSIETPYGSAGLYLYNGSARTEKIIESGDWADIKSK